MHLFFVVKSVTENLSKQGIVGMFGGGFCGFFVVFFFLCECVLLFWGFFLGKKAEPSRDVSNEGTGLSLLYP